MSEERCALVVGASSGIGRAVAVRLAARGMRVVAAARRQPQLESLAAETGASVVVGDIASEAGCLELVASAEETLGRIDVLVNTAAIGAAHETTILDEPFADWRHTMTMNLDAPFHLIQACASGMAGRGFGRIVMIGSTASEQGGRRMPAYTASKHGLLGLVRAAAIDLAPHGITCNVVAPGWVKTEMSQRLVDTIARERGVSTDLVWAEIGASYPSGRTASTSEVAHAIVMLTDDAAGGINGQCVAVAMGSTW